MDRRDVDAYRDQKQPRRRFGVSPRGGDRFASSPHEQSCVVLRLFFPHSTVATPPCIHYTALLYPYPPPFSLYPPPMLAFLALLSLSAVPLAAAQGDLLATNNVTDLEGTWSSNSAVSTGGVSRSRPSWAFLTQYRIYVYPQR